MLRLYLLCLFACIAVDASAWSCARPVTMPFPESTPEQRIAMEERIRDSFLSTFAERDVVFKGKVEALSPPIRTDGHQFRIATIRVKQALNNSHVETVDVTVNDDIKQGNDVFVLAKKESPVQAA